MDEILNTYDFVPPVKVTSLSRISPNNSLWEIHTGNGGYVWKTYTSPSYEDPASIHYEHRLLKYLAEAALSFHVPQPLPNRHGEILHATPHGWSVLITKFLGAPLNPSCYEEVTRFGSALGELQTVLQAYPVTPRPGHHLFAEFFNFPASAYNPFTLTSEQLGLPDFSSTRELLCWWHEEAERLHTFVTTEYQTLPWQICHNDVSPNNLLVDNGQISAILDFEFVTPAARAFDVAMALRMTMRTWENPAPWDTIRAFFRGYSPWIQLTEQEISALPQLIRLRNVMGTLLSLGCQRNFERILTHIEYKHNSAIWFEQNESQFVDIIAHETHETHGK